jgi:hypothetical protein
MQEALTILQALGHELGLSAEITGIITYIRQYDRLAGGLTGVGTILNWLETAANDLSALANVFPPSTQTAAHFRYEAGRMRSYIGRLRALGVLPASLPSTHDPPADVEQG